MLVCSSFPSWFISWSYFIVFLWCPTIYGHFCGIIGSVKLSFFNYLISCFSDGLRNRKYLFDWRGSWWQTSKLRQFVTPVTVKLFSFSIMNMLASLTSMWPSAAIWQHRSGSIFAQVMACCVMHQVITWTNIDLSSVRSSDICLRTVSQEIPQPSITEISWQLLI